MPAVHSLHEHFRQSATRLSGDVAQHRMGQQTAVMLGWQLPRIATALWPRWDVATSPIKQHLFQSLRCSKMGDVSQGQQKLCSHIWKTHDWTWYLGRQIETMCAFANLQTHFCSHSRETIRSPKLQRLESVSPEQMKAKEATVTYRKTTSTNCVLASAQPKKGLSVHQTHQNHRKIGVQQSCPCCHIPRAQARVARRFFSMNVLLDEKCLPIDPQQLAWSPRWQWDVVAFGVYFTASHKTTQEVDLSKLQSNTRKTRHLQITCIYTYIYIYTVYITYIVYTSESLYLYLHFVGICRSFTQERR